MSTTNITIPYFAKAPDLYSPEYTAQVTRQFSLLAQQLVNPGPTRAETLNLSGLGVYANNTAAKAGGLVEDDVYKTSTGELRIVV
jgi:hypothetical protein